MAAVYCQIKNLTLHAHSFYINALIIAKTEKRVIQPGRNVITLTVRDTKDHFINCTVWVIAHAQFELNGLFRLIFPIISYVEQVT